MSQTKIAVGMLDASSIGDAKVLQGDGAWVTPATADMVQVGSTVLTDTASEINFLSLDTTTYQHFVFYIYAVLSTTALLHVRFNVTGGSMETGAAAYQWGLRGVYVGSASSTTSGFDGSDDRIDLNANSSSSDQPHIAVFKLFNPDVAADRTFFMYQSIAAPNTSWLYELNGGGRMLATGAHNGISFFPASGTFISGDMIQAYGIK